LACSGLGDGAKCANVATPSSVILVFKVKMKRETRIVFSFNEQSLQQLNEVMDSGSFRTMAEALSEALWAYRGLQSQAEEGFSEVIVRNPKSGEERVMRVTRPLTVKLLDTLKGAKAS
jgi:hypothetical protein